MGGLGNQMFQYAFARALSLHFHTEILLDIFFYKHLIPNVTPRNYELSLFPIESFTLKKNQLEKMIKQESFFLLKERFEFKYDEELIKKVQNNSYLIGYWQSWKYFYLIENQIKKEFNFPISHFSQKTHDLAQSIKSQLSVSIHIRKTDYYKPETLGVISLTYYERAIRYIKQYIKDPYFFIFSDDHNDIDDILNLPIKYRIVKGNTAIEDMYLMSRCKHNIIANSTFSWWAAWLNPEQEKIVIAPLQWHQNKNGNIDTSDLLPPNWVCI